jgi:Flp pilus assembly protein TadG
VQERRPEQHDIQRRHDEHDQWENQLRGFGRRRAGFASRRTGELIMVSSHDRRGSTAIEFAMICLVFFFMLFGIVDLGLYGLTTFSLRTLASETARGVIIECLSSTTYITTHVPVAGCAVDPYTTAQKQDIAPFLYWGGLTPTVVISGTTSPITVTVTQSGFSVLLPVAWGNVLNAPSMTTTVVF